PRAEPREFLNQTPVVEAGGLRELHVARCLHTPALLKYLVLVAPERIDLGLHATSRADTLKYLAKLMMLRHIHRELGRPMPPYLAKADTRPARLGGPNTRTVSLWTVWPWRFLHPLLASRVDPRLPSIDWSPLAPYRLDFYWKY